MKTIIIFICIFITGSIVYWILGAYFLWDINWFSTIGEMEVYDRLLGFLLYIFVQILCMAPYIDYTINNMD